MASQANEQFPYEIRDVETKLNEELMKYFKGELTGFVRVGPKGYLFQSKYRQIARNMYNIPLKPTDIFVATYPRSGTTWTQELVWLVANDLDYACADASLLTYGRYSFLESNIYFHPMLEKQLLEENVNNEENTKILKLVMRPGTELLADMPSPRFIKTHLPLSLLPPTLLDISKVVYVARDPRDVAVSFYHLNSVTKVIGYVGDFKTFWNFFIGDLIAGTPYFEHVKEAWEKRHHPNMLFLFYEELSKDLPAVVRRVCDFLGKQFTDEQIVHLCDYLSFENFKNNKSVNHDHMQDPGITQFTQGNQTFIRKGKVGGWRSYFDDEMSQQAERWIADNLRDTDFRFPHLDEH